MKHLFVRYKIPNGDFRHLTNFFPFLRCFINAKMRYHLAQQIRLLPALAPVMKNQQ